MSKLDTVRALLMKAGRADTPIEEARNAALQAARLIVEHGFTIQGDEKEEGGVSFPDDFEVPEFFAETPAVLFNVRPYAATNLTCCKCGLEIRKGQQYASEAQTKVPRVTHYNCRYYFIQGQG